MLINQALQDYPWQLLERGETSEKYKALWLNYAFAMKGKQLVWSRTKRKVGLKDKSDDIAEEQIFLRICCGFDGRAVADRFACDKFKNKQDDRVYFMAGRQRSLMV